MTILSWKRCGFRGLHLACRRCSLCIPWSFLMLVPRPSIKSGWRRNWVNQTASTETDAITAKLSATLRGLVRNAEALGMPLGIQQIPPSGRRSRWGRSSSRSLIRTQFTFLPACDICCYISVSYPRRVVVFHPQATQNTRVSLFLPKRNTQIFSFSDASYW